MRPRTLAVIAAALLFALPAAAQKIAVKDLPPRYRTWIQEEVVYIISPKEKAVFLQLSNDREREMFIEAFWKARDTEPSTPENEVKIEHERRIKFANDNFGRGLEAGGWRSDRGRIYITLGEPKQIEKYENLSNVYPMLVWFYSGLTSPSLPSSFNIVFYKPNDAGDYVLYSPMKDGPQKLMPFYNGDMSSYIDAYRQLVEIEPRPTTSTATPSSRSRATRRGGPSSTISSSRAGSAWRGSGTSTGPHSRSTASSPAPAAGRSTSSTGRSRSSFRPSSSPRSRTAWSRSRTPSP